MKKKIMALGIAVCLAIGLAACGSSGGSSAANAGSSASSDASLTQKEENSAAGIYKMVEMVSEDETISKDTLKGMEAYGIVAYIELSDDGTATLDMGGDVTEGTWNEDDSTVTIEGETIPYTLDGDTLVFSEDEVTITFERTTREDIDSITQGSTQESAAATNS